MDTFYIERVVHTGLSSSVPAVIRYRAVVNDEIPTGQRDSKEAVRTDVFLRWPQAEEVADPFLLHVQRTCSDNP